MLFPGHHVDSVLWNIMQGRMARTRCDISMELDLMIELSEQIGTLDLLKDANLVAERAEDRYGFCFFSFGLWIDLFPSSRPSPSSLRG